MSANMQNRIKCLLEDICEQAIFSIDCVQYNDGKEQTDDVLEELKLDTIKLIDRIESVGIVARFIFGNDQGYFARVYTLHQSWIRGAYDEIFAYMPELLGHLRNTARGDYVPELKGQKQYGEPV